MMSNQSSSSGKGAGAGAGAGTGTGTCTGTGTGESSDSIYLSELSKGNALLIMRVTGKNDKTCDIYVCEEDDAVELAREFVLFNNLPENKIGRVAKAIEKRRREVLESDFLSPTESEVAVERQQNEDVTEDVPPARPSRHMQESTALPASSQLLQAAEPNFIPQREGMSQPIELPDSSMVSSDLQSVQVYEDGTDNATGQNGVRSAVSYDAHPDPFPDDEGALNPVEYEEICLNGDENNYIEDMNGQYGELSNQQVEMHTDDPKEHTGDVLSSSPGRLYVARQGRCRTPDTLTAYVQSNNENNRTPESYRDSDDMYSEKSRESEKEAVFKRAKADWKSRLRYGTFNAHDGAGSARGSAGLHRQSQGHPDSLLTRFSKGKSTLPSTAGDGAYREFSSASNSKNVFDKMYNAADTRRGRQRALKQKYEQDLVSEIREKYLNMKDLATRHFESQRDVFPGAGDLQGQVSDGHVRRHPLQKQIISDPSDNDRFYYANQVWLKRKHKREALALATAQREKELEDIHNLTFQPRIPTPPEYVKPRCKGHTYENGKDGNGNGHRSNGIYDELSKAQIGAQSMISELRMCMAAADETIADAGLKFKPTINERSKQLAAKARKSRRSRSHDGLRFDVQTDHNGHRKQAVLANGSRDEALQEKGSARLTSVYDFETPSPSAKSFSEKYKQGKPKASAPKNQDKNNDALDDLLGISGEPDSRGPSRVNSGIPTDPAATGLGPEIHENETLSISRKSSESRIPKLIAKSPVILLPQRGSGRSVSTGRATRGGDMASGTSDRQRAGGGTRGHSLSPLRSKRATIFDELHQERLKRVSAKVLNKLPTPTYAPDIGVSAYRPVEPSKTAFFSRLHTHDLESHDVEELYFLKYLEEELTCGKSAVHLSDKERATLYEKLAVKDAQRRQALRAENEMRSRQLFDEQCNKKRCGRKSQEMIRDARVRSFSEIFDVLLLTQEHTLLQQRAAEQTFIERETPEGVDIADSIPPANQQSSRDESKTASRSHTSAVNDTTAPRPNDPGRMVNVSLEEANDEFQLVTDRSNALIEKLVRSYEGRGEDTGMDAQNQYSLQGNRLQAINSFSSGGSVDESGASKTRDGEDILTVTLAEPSVLQPSLLANFISKALQSSHIKRISRSSFVMLMDAAAAQHVGPPIHNLLTVASARPLPPATDDLIAMQATGKPYLQARPVTEYLAERRARREGAVRAEGTYRMLYDERVSRNHRHEGRRLLREREEGARCTFKPTMYTSERSRSRSKSRSRSLSADKAVSRPNKDKSAPRNSAIDTGDGKSGKNGRASGPIDNQHARHSGHSGQSEQSVASSLSASMAGENKALKKRPHSAPRLRSGMRSRGSYSQNYELQRQLKK